MLEQFAKMKLLLLVFGLMAAQANLSHSKLLLSVYYESKCGDSKRFIVEQLEPTVNELQDYLQLKLIPFGKANSINHGIHGFECQHGPTECRGNMVQDCALDLMAGRSDAEMVHYVACEMQTQAGTTGNLQCVQVAHLPVENVKHCLNSRKGIDLQLRSEHLTKLVSPKFVPTITVNGHFDQQIQDRAQHDLFGTLCALLPEAEPCAHHHNHAALQPTYY